MYNMYWSIENFLQKIDINTPSIIEVHELDGLGSGYVSILWKTIENLVALSHTTVCSLFVCFGEHAVSLWSMLIDVTTGALMYTSSPLHTC